MPRPEAPPPALNPHLRKLEPYPPGRPIEEVEREFGLKNVVKLASNENPLGPSPKAMKAMIRAVREMHLYPDGSGFYLKQAIGEKIGVSPDELILGNGSDEITGFLAQAYLGRGKTLVTSNYAFVRYRMAAEAAGARAELMPMTDMRHNLDAIAAAVGPETVMVCLDIPCNPTGTVVSVRDFKSFLGRVPARVIVLLDQAYYEYAAADSAYFDGLTLRNRFPNLIVTRTFSKAYGLAGLRIGYAVARPEIVRDVDRLRPPFNTNRMAQAAAIAALDDSAHLKKSVAANAKGRVQLEKGFAGLGLKYWPSHANFILVDTGRDCRQLFIELQKLGVITRPMAGYGLATHLRISIGTAAENQRCLGAFKQLLG